MFFGPTGSITRMHQDIDMSNVFRPSLKAGRGWSCFLLIKAGYCINSFNVHSTVDLTIPTIKHTRGLCRRNDRWFLNMATHCSGAQRLLAPRSRTPEGGFGIEYDGTPLRLKLLAVYHHNGKMDRSVDESFVWPTMVYLKKNLAAGKKRSDALESDHHHHHGGENGLSLDETFLYSYSYLFLQE